MLWHIRRVRDNEVVGAGQTVETAHVVKLDPARHIVPRGVTLGHRDRGWRDVGRRDPCVPELLGQRYGETAGAGTDVGDIPRCRPVHEQCQRRFDQ